MAPRYTTAFEISFNSLDDFLTHWASRYNDANDTALYDPHIGTADLKSDRAAVETLFKWKNGGTLAPQHPAGISANYFDHWIEDDALENRYLNPQAGGGPIWNIFYLHCRFPKLYPIYDQHAYRAMLYMQTGVICEKRDDLGNKSAAFIYATYRDYRDFVAGIRCATGRNLRSIDRALYTFGQFLKRARPYWVPSNSKSHYGLRFGRPVRCKIATVPKRHRP